MAPDFLPLDVGNVWRYDVVDAEGNTNGNLEFHISDYSIVEGVSFYVFDRFPFAPDLEIDRPVGVRYDPDNRQFVWFDGQNQSDLFPSLGASAEVLEASDDGLPIRALFRFGSLVLTLERGVGITQAGFVTTEGPLVASLVAARVSGEVIGAMEPDRPAPASITDPIPVADPIDETVAPEDVEPDLGVEALREGDLHRFVLTVRNPSQRLMPFDFSTSQNFDFIVVDPSHGQEIWRWSRRRFFSEVLRSEAIRPGREWTFEGEWNHRDSAMEEVEPGVYEVFGILTAQDPIESEPIRFEVP